ncbi:MAG: ACT domain-containing protein [Thermoleophilia bacterium]|nr:ACT domain-containing protein [Thermoleophilia bacterium]
MMPENELSILLSEMRPEKRPGRFVFVELPEEGIPGVEMPATVHEPEGVSAVLKEADADRHGLSYDFVAGWITLRVESSLSAVGLTAAVSSCLSEEGISCNVIAGLHHDHLLVPIERVDEAVRALEDLAAG